MYCVGYICIVLVVIILCSSYPYRVCGILLCRLHFIVLIVLYSVMSNVFFFVSWTALCWLSRIVLDIL